jgi:glucose-1-phosphate thymidylyltransferase
LYFYDNTAVQRARSLKPSHRGELEITDLNNSYIEDGKLNVKLLKNNAAWFDTGSADAMFEAAMFIKSIQSRTGQIIGCVEEVAYKRQLIDEHTFHGLIRDMPLSQYKRYLRNKYQVMNQVA